jgi:hypothetical protein
MSSSSSSSSSGSPCRQKGTVSDGALVEAGVRAGDNASSAAGASEYWVDASGDRADGQVVWDSTPADTYNSGAVGFVLIVDSSGSATWTVGGAGALTVQGPAVNSLTSVQLEAARDDSNYELLFADVTVEFYAGNTVVGPGALPEVCWPRVGPNPSQVIEVPAPAGANKVVVTGTVRLRAATTPTTSPPANANDLRGRILVYGT